MASPATVQAQISGLQRANNLWSSSKPGSLATADNTVLDQANILGPRRGFEALSYGFGSSSSRAGQLHYYGATLLVQYASKLAYDTGAALTDFAGTFAPTNLGAPLNRMAFANAAGNCYFNANDGLRVMSGIVEPVQAGIPKGLYTSPSNASNNGWQTHNTAVAYRGVWGLRDAANNVKLGVPSGRAVLRNYILAPIGGCVIAANVCTVTLNANAPHGLAVADVVTLAPGEAGFAAGAYAVTAVPTTTSFRFALVAANATSTAVQEFQITRSATVREYFPPGITINHFYRLYRSDMSATAATEPSDELYLAYTIQPTAAQIVTGYFDVNDITPEAFLGDPLYTNQFDGVGLQQAKERPPIARSLAWFDDRLFFGNTLQRQRFFLDLLGVGTPNGVQDGDRLLFTNGATVTIITFKAAPGAGEVQIYSADTPALNIARTTDALIKVLNATSALPFAAYSLSSDDGIPGKMLLEEKAIGGAAFFIQADRPLSFNPYMTNELGASLASSDGTAQIHGLGYSVQGEPEAVPVFNFTTVGSQSWPILRIARIKSALIVFKGGEGIWSVTGQAPYRVEQISTANLVGPDTVAILSDRLWALTDQGEVSISESAGITVTSRPIETDILALFGAELANLTRYAFGVGYETDRAYLLWLPETSGSAICTEAYRQSCATDGFTRWTKAATAGVVDPNTSKLVIASGTANQILVERKAFDSTDFADESFAVTISSSTGTAVVLASATGVTVGDVLSQGTKASLVLAISGNTLTVLSTEAWTAAAATVYTGIPVDVEFNPVTGGDPALSKLTRQLTWLFQAARFYSANAEFSSEASSGVSTVAMLGTGWGYQAWGRFAWGSPQPKLKRIEPIPEAKRVASQLTVGLAIRQAFAAWKMQGFVASLDGLTEVNSR